MTGHGQGMTGKECGMTGHGQGMTGEECGMPPLGPEMPPVTRSVTHEGYCGKQGKGFKESL